MSSFVKRFGVGFSAPPAENPEVEITAISATPVREPESKRSYVVVTLETSAGLTGVSEAPARPDPVSAARQFEKLKPVLLGRDARSYIPIDLEIQRSAPVADVSAARGAVNIALLDVLGKLAEAPLYEALGGPTRDKIRALAVVAGLTNEAVVHEARVAHAAGYRAFAVPLPEQQGLARGSQYFKDVRGRLDDLRAALGGDSDFVLDCGGAITPAVGLSIAAECEDVHLLWLEEPGGDLSAEALSAIANNSVVPVGYGRNIAHDAKFQDLLRLDGIDVLRPDIVTRGVTGVKKAAAMAETYYIAIAPYHRGGPIGTAAALHAAAALPNFFIQEVPFGSKADRDMRAGLSGVRIEEPVNGFFLLPPGPGLGVKIDKDALEEYRVRG